MLCFALTIFVSAFLLFQVQPLIARFILPWFGGTPAVWSTCMLFFQLLLLGGYSYAHILNHFRPRTQGLVHMVLLIAACLMLPIIPNDSLKPSGEDSPVLKILLVLTFTIGLPYFVVSTTGPLLQSWFAMTYPGRSPYRLFALSNFGSLVALLTYPFLFEPYLRQNIQAYWWSGGFGLFAMLCGWCALMIYKGNGEPAIDVSKEATDDRGSGNGKTTKASEPTDRYSHLVKPNFFSVLLWIGLSMVPSILLLATTNQVCQEVAVVPFLWVLPLALYLVTFIICFEAPYLYIRFLFYPLFGLSVLAAVVCLYMGVDAPMWVQVAGLISAFFFGSLVCHGELACSKPGPKYLTLYYLAISIGGALGGVFVVLIAPNIFKSYFELHTGLVLAICLTAIAFHSRADNRFFRYVPYLVSVGISLIIMIALSCPIIIQAVQSVAKSEDKDEQVILRERDFWGVLTVKESRYTQTNDDGTEETTIKRQLLNGRINHGMQFVNEKWQRYKTTYYCEGSGVGLAVARNPRRLAGKDLKIGVIGLGTGTMAAWGIRDDTIRFYEINPLVKQVAEEKFFYLTNATKDGVNVDVILGDARIQMQRQVENNDAQGFDLIAVDAFSSDAIPRHLLTLESVKLYQQHLRDEADGIIAIHISNRFLDLEGICYRIGKELGYEPVLIEFSENDGNFWEYSNTWVLLTHNTEFLDDPEVLISHGTWAVDWHRNRLQRLIEQLTDDEIDLSQSEDYDFGVLALRHAATGRNRFEELVDSWQDAQKTFDQNRSDTKAKTRMENAREAVEEFLSDELDEEIKLVSWEEFDREKFGKMVEVAREQSVLKTYANWQKAKKQFQVLWTDDFGSLWQVIRLEFDWKKNRKEILDWWNEYWETDNEEDD